MAQSWRNLLFAHWPVDAARLAPLVPPPLRLETFDGAAWLGLTPFAVIALRARLLPPVPALSRFTESNLRTYVTFEGRPGIFFLTLDTDSLPAVLGGRLGYRLPYRRGTVNRSIVGSWTEHRSASPALQFTARYAPAGSSFEAGPGSLEKFLIERYCLYARTPTALVRADIHHEPWRIYEADAATTVGVAATALGPLAEPVLLHVAPRQDVLVWPPTRAARV